MLTAFAKPSAPSDDKRWTIVETRMRRLGNRPDALIEALHSAQEAFGYLDDDALRLSAARLGVPPSKVYGVATFYSLFTLKPQGEHTCVVCTGTACYINGAPEILAAIQRGLGVKPGETTADGKLSLLTARCLGACSLAPAAIVDGEVEGRVEAAELVRPDWRRCDRARRTATPSAPSGRRADAVADRRPGGAGARLGVRLRGRQLPVGRSRTRSLTGSASGSRAPGSPTSRSSASAASGCAPPGPLVQDPGDRPALRAASGPTTSAPSSRRSQPSTPGATPGADGRRSSAARCASRPRTPAGSTPRASRTTSRARRLRRRCGRSLTAMTPAEVREEITRSGLRGRGGAGFPTGLKWSTVAKADRLRRSTSSATPTKATPARSWTAACWRATRTASSRAWPSPAYAVGASEGYVYCRGEYPLAVSRLRDGHPAGATGPATSAPTIARHRVLASTSRSGSAPAPSCAAKRRR